MIPEGPSKHEIECTYAIAWAPAGAQIGLDIGCGAHKVADWLIGVDHHSGEWTDALGGDHLSRPDILADARELPYATESIDFIASRHLLEHFADPMTVLVGWRRVLRVGGRMAIVVPDWRHTFSCKQPDQQGEPEAHKYDYTLPILCGVLLSLPGTELIDARIVCARFSVGAVVEKIREENRIDIS